MLLMEKDRKSRPKITSYRVLAINILKESKEPMTSNEIIQIILKTKKIHGKTPANSLRAVLQRSNSFRRVGKSKYILNENYAGSYKDDDKLDIPHLLNPDFN